MSKVPTKRAAPLSIRLSASERETLERQAGDQPLSIYIKSVVLRGDAGRKTQAEHVMLARVLAALGRSQLAASLETLAREAASGSLYLDEATVHRLHQAFNDVAAMHYCLLWALGKRPERQLTLPPDLARHFTRTAQEGGGQ